MKKIALLLVSLLALAACETNSKDKLGTAGAGNETLEGLTGEARAAQEALIGLGDRVFFAFDSSTLTSEGEATLQNQAKWLKENASIKVKVEGHCDERGTREYNLALGERRAIAAKNYLVSLGVEAARISTISYGKEKPAVMGSNEDTWSKNRRAVTIVTQK